MQGSNRVWLIRFSSEIFTKGEGVKRQFIYLLAKNVKEALLRKGIKAEVIRDRDRVYVWTRDDVSYILKKVFGISSFSPSIHTSLTSLENLKAFVRDSFKDSVRGKKFAVRVKVRDKNLSVRMLERELGGALYDYSDGVNLDNPDVQVNLEIRGMDVYAYTDVIRGYGGFPVGSQGKALSLISGGFDSAVASWKALRRGLKVMFLMFDMGGEIHINGTKKIVETLYETWIYGYKPEMYVLEMWPLLKSLYFIYPNLRLIILKRFMYKLGEIMAKNLECDAIITGESVGQISTQTLHNLRIIEESINIPIFRPLIFSDKEEIIKLSKEIGTYEISEKIPEFCAIAPAPPPRVKLSDVKREEKKILGILEEILNSAKKIVIGEGKYRDDVFVDRIPEGAKVINLEETDFYEIIENMGNMDRKSVYVFVCKEGAKSRQIAKIFRNHGFKAFYTSM